MHQWWHAMRWILIHLDTFEIFWFLLAGTCLEFFYSSTSGDSRCHGGQWDHSAAGRICSWALDIERKEQSGSGANFKQSNFFPGKSTCSRYGRGKSSCQQPLIKGIPSLKLTYPLKIGLSKRKFHFPTIDFQGLLSYVSFKEGMLVYMQGKSLSHHEALTVDGCCASEMCMEACDCWCWCKHLWQCIQYSNTVNKVKKYIQVL